MKRDPREDRSALGAPRQKTRPWVSGSGLLGAAALAVGSALWLGTLLPFAEPLWWPFGLLVHFRPQYLALAVGGSLVLWIAHRRRAAGVFAACAIPNVLLLLSYLLPSAQAPAGARSALHTAMLANVQTENRDHAAVRSLVRRESPDFLVLLEVDAGWLEGLADLHALYPHRIEAPRADNFGIALFSKHPCVRCGVLRLGEAGLPTVAGEFSIRERVAPHGARPLRPAPLPESRFTLVGTHPLPPISAENIRLQESQLSALALYLRSVPGPKLLLGDLNATPWSPRFGQLLRDAGLRDSARGRWVWRTWPADQPVLGIPIDHALASPDVAIVSHTRGPDIGSDHFPILVAFHP